MPPDEVVMKGKEVHVIEESMEWSAIELDNCEVYGMSELEMEWETKDLRLTRWNGSRAIDSI